MVPTEADIAYFAGIFDGEGCVSIQSGRQRDGTEILRMRLLVSNTCLPLLSFIQERFGGYIDWVDKRSRRPCYHLRFDGSLAGTVLEVLLPYLIVKREVGRVALEFRSLVGKTGTDERRAALRAKVMQLNSGAGGNKRG